MEVSFKSNLILFSNILSELEINQMNAIYKSKLITARSPRNVEVYLNNIKLCLQFPIQLVLSGHLRNKDLLILEEYLSNPNHKIFVLNLSRVNTGSIGKVISVLDKDGISYTNLDVIYFGYHVLAQIEFIKFGKWLINKFSSKRDNDSLQLRRYLWGCPSNKPRPEENSHNFDNIVDRSFQHREERSGIYRSSGLDMSTISDDQDKRVQVVLKFQRKLYADDLKTLLHITQKCDKKLLLNIEAKELQEESEFFKREENVCNGFLRNLMAKRRRVSAYKFFDNIEERINFNILVKFAYASFVVNLCLCILLPLLMKHEECGKGLLWSAHVVYGGYLIMSQVVSVLVFKICFDKATRGTLFEKNSKWMVYTILLGYCLVGILSMGDIYTDIAFLVEMWK